ncbi:MAG: hypothetical protein L0191_12820, partial [Acidobacteria bacterium]|nr:hypothetical protein [Acidobacteriota bacterium]
GRVDYLRGLKENVIMGRLIPAGTGMEVYRRFAIPEATPAERRPELPGEELEREMEYIVDERSLKAFSKEEVEQA